MRFLYISNGNIPSPWAHTVQVMKMAEAFTACSRGFRLLIAGDWRSLVGGSVDLRRWYGLTGRVRLTRLRMGWKLDPGALEAVNWPEFNEAATAWAIRHRPSLVMTRSYHIALACLDGGLEVLFETHAGPDHAHIELVRAMASRRGLRGVVTIADRLREAYMELGVPADRILIWPDAVDPARFANLDIQRAAMRGRLGITPGQSVVVYTGHLYEQKGVGTLLEAARRLPHVRFLIVGGWPKDVDRLRDRFADLSGVDFRGFVPNAEVPSYLAAADVCALPNSSYDSAAAWTSPL
jgi:glycosyltransferase involved in cell wall biosynthesis